MSEELRYDLHSEWSGELSLTLKPGMGWAIYTDHGPTGICGQSMSITCPHSVFRVWPDEESMRADLDKSFRKGSKANLQFGVIGQWSSGRGAVVVSAALPRRCEHGVADGDWCEPCNKAYKDAAKDQANQ
jgi:hypothetical protein